MYGPSPDDSPDDSMDLVRVRQLLSCVGILIDNRDYGMAHQFIDRIDDMLRPPELAKVIPLVPRRR